MTASSIASSWYCDECYNVFKHGEMRLNCVVCRDYDLCKDCVVTLNPAHPHQLVPELAYKHEEVSGSYAVANVANNLQIAASVYQDRHCLGMRDVHPTDPTLYADTYSWLTFEAVFTRVTNFGHGLRTLIEPRGYLAICGKNRPEWVIADFACICQNIVTVPIYCLLNDRELVYIINHTKVSVIVCDAEMMRRFVLLLPQCPALRHIVCMDVLPDAYAGTDNTQVSLHYMGDIEMHGAQEKYDPAPVDPDECLTIVYTSGSSGFPKGAVIPECKYQATLSKHCRLVAFDLINFGYEPLAWVTGREGVARAFLMGGRTAFATGDTCRLMEDLALVRPTTFAGTPAVWNKIYSEYMTALSLATAQLPEEAKLAERSRVMQEFSKLIPARCRMLGIGGAKVSSAVLDFMKECFPQCTIYESYGTTECGGLAVDTIIKKGLQFRLVSVPEMGYTTEDQPYARGELYVKTDDMFSGYFNNPEETAAALTEDGFFRTGDIVELRPMSDGQCQTHVIDRRKNFFKLSQGQFISPESLESIYIQSSFVKQIYIHGDLLADSVAAVVVPDRDFVQASALHESEHNAQLHAAILRDLHSIAARHSLGKHEVPSRLLIDYEPFTAENGLLTSTLKFCRHKLAAHYSARLKESVSIKQRLKALMETTIARSLPSDEKETMFIPTGGDSLTTVRLSRRIEQDLGVTIPAGMLLKPDMTLEQLASMIENPSTIAPTSDSIVPQLLNDSRLNLNIDASERKAVTMPPSTVFITGATGFVGGFLLAELLSTYPSECKFICLVRCNSIANAVHRIRKNMRFLQIWKDEFQRRLLPLPGDLSKPNFGLNSETYQSLVDQTDLIFHCGATVNFLLPYSALYNANVEGTRQIIQLAIARSMCIPVHYISTLSVLPAASPEKLTTGYAQSKWVAEKLATQASDMGLPIVIYRLGSIGASVQTGACNRTDLHTLLIAAMMKHGCYPKTIVNSYLQALPADTAARRILHLSSQEPFVTGKVYHIVDSSDGVAFADVIQCLHGVSGPLQMVPSEEWRKILVTTDEEVLANISFDQQSSSSTLIGVPSSLDDQYLMRWLSFIRNQVFCLDRTGGEN